MGALTKEVLDQIPLHSAGYLIAEDDDIGRCLGVGEDRADLTEVEGRIGCLRRCLACHQSIRSHLNVDYGVRPERPRLVKHGLVEWLHIAEVKVLTAVGFQCQSYL